MADADMTVTPEKDVPDTTQVSTEAKTTEAPVVYKDRKVYNIVDMDQAEKALIYAQWAVTKKVAPKGLEPAQYYMLLLAGNDLGMNLMEINNSLCIINGRVAIYGPEVISRVNRAGYRIEWVEKSKEKVIATISSPNRQHTEEFTLQQAKDAGIYKDVWLKYPIDMLSWKVVARLVRFFCPEVIGGYVMKEDYEAGTATITTTKKPPLKKLMENNSQDEKPE